MRKKIIIIIKTLIIILALLGCDSIGLGKDKEAPPPAAAAPAAAKPPAPKKFVPPADSAVSERQFGVWKECNILLDSLTSYYADSFKTPDPIRMLRLQEDFLKAKDRICRRAGLPGGHDEYKWIASALGNPQNYNLLGFDIWN